MLHARTWADVDLAALKRNLALVQGHIGDDVAVMLVVKADAYGHGAVPVSWHLLRHGVTALGVGDSTEALELREAGITAPILILGAVVTGEWEDVVRGDIHVSVHSGDRVRALRRHLGRSGPIVGVHIKVDTGMGRLGCHPERVLGRGDGACGISLNIPVEEQLRAIRSGLPDVRRIGLLFDPSVNGDLFAEAAASAARLGLSLIPLEVSSKPGIPGVLDRSWGRIDALWFVPDQTVISESIVEYVTRESIFNKVPAFRVSAIVIKRSELYSHPSKKAWALLTQTFCRLVRQSSDGSMHARI